MTSAAWQSDTVSPLPSTTSKTPTAQQRCLYPTYQGAKEFHTPVHLKVGGLEHTEEVETGESWRWCLQSWHSRGCSSSRGGGAYNSSLLAAVAPVATGNWAAVAVGSGIPTLQPLRCPRCHPLSSNPAAAEPMELKTPDTAEAPMHLGSHPPASLSPCCSRADTQGNLHTAEEPTILVPQAATPVILTVAQHQ